MKKGKNYVITFIGILIFVAGLFLLKMPEEPSKFLMALPYVCIGVGCGIFGQGLANVLSHRLLRKNPELRRQMEINEKDERNAAVANRAKARAYDVMVFVFGALMLAFALMGVDVVPVLLLVAAYLYVQGYAFVCRCKYDKEM